MNGVRGTEAIVENVKVVIGDIEDVRSKVNALFTVFSAQVAALVATQKQLDDEESSELLAERKRDAIETISAHSNSVRRILTNIELCCKEVESKEKAYRVKADELEKVVEEDEEASQEVEEESFGPRVAEQIPRDIARSLATELRWREAARGKARDAADAAELALNVLFPSRRRRHERGLRTNPGVQSSPEQWEQSLLHGDLNGVVEKLKSQCNCKVTATIIEQVQCLQNADEKRCSCLVVTWQNVMKAKFEFVPSCESLSGPQEPIDGDDDDDDDEDVDMEHPEKQVDGADKEPISVLNMVLDRVSIFSIGENNVGTQTHSKYSVFRNMSAKCLEAQLHFESSKRDSQSQSLFGAAVAERMLVWLCQYHNLFLEPCSAGGSMLVLNPNDSVMIPVTQRPLADSFA